MNLNIFFWLRTLLIATICGVYGYSFIGSEQPPNSGDGLIHFFISQASWSDPILFFHHWGKPFFTIISSPFSQLGYGGIVLFNCLVFAGTSVFSWKILDHFKVDRTLSLIFPIALFCIPDIYETTLSGLTEPFFNLVLITAFYFLIKKNFLIFAIIVSFLPFCRSEGQLALIVAIPLLAFLKEYKSIPFLLSGFLIYAFFGLIFLGDFFWYFNLSPYDMGNDIYGSGTWSHYLESYSYYLGQLGLILLVVGILSFVFIAIKKQSPSINLIISLFGLSTFFGVLTAHSYFWATGQNGSLGLTRIATQGVPMAIVIALIYIGHFNFWKAKLTSLIFAITSLTILVLYIPQNAKFVRAKNLDLSIHQTAEFLQDKNQRIQYYHPLIAYKLNENPFDKSESNLIRNESELALSHQLKTTFQPGDLIIRDSYFGREGKVLTLKSIEEEESLVLIEEFPSQFQHQDPENGVEGVRVYQYLPQSKNRIPVNQQRKTVRENEIINIKSKDEYTGIIDTLTEDMSYFQTSLISNSSDLKLVLDLYEGQTIQYYDIKIGAPLIQDFAIGSKGHIKYYVWNPKRVDASITIQKISNNAPQKYVLK